MDPLQELDEMDAALQPEKKPTPAPEPAPTRSPEPDPGPAPTTELVPVDDQALPTHTAERINYTLEQAEADLARHVQVMGLVRKYAVHGTRPQDWQDMAGDGSKVMLDGAGAERLLTRLPLRWSMEITSSIREDYPNYPESCDIPFAYIVTGNISAQIPGFEPVELKGIQAGRGANKWFQAGAAAQGRMVDPLDVKSAAETAWKRRAITIVLGLRGLSIDDLKEIAGPAFTGKVGKVKRRGGMSKSAASFTEVGKETADEMGGASDAHKAVWTELQRLAKNTRKHWKPILMWATADKRSRDRVEGAGQRRYAPRESVMGMTEKAAGYAVGRLRELQPEEATGIIDLAANAAKGEQWWTTTVACYTTGGNVTQKEGTARWNLHAV